MEVTVNAPVEDEAARRRREFLEEDEMDYRRERREAMKGDGLATASLTLGIVSFVAVFFCFCGGHLAAVPLALLGLGCGLYARADRRVAGIILNLLALIPGALALAFAATLLNMLGCAAKITK